MSARRVSMLRGSSEPRPRASRVSQVNAPAAWVAVSSAQSEAMPSASGVITTRRSRRACAVPLLGAVGVGGEHGTREGGLELGQGLLRRLVQDPGLHARASSGASIQVASSTAGPSSVDLPGLPQRVCVGQRRQQPVGQPDPGAGGTARQVQRDPDLVGGVLAAHARPARRVRCLVGAGAGGPARPAVGPAGRPPRRRPGRTRSSPRSASRRTAGPGRRWRSPGPAPATPTAHMTRRWAPARRDRPLPRVVGLQVGIGVRVGEQPLQHPSRSSSGMPSPQAGVGSASMPSNICSILPH